MVLISHIDAHQTIFGTFQIVIIPLKAC